MKKQLLLLAGLALTASSAVKAQNVKFIPQRVQAALPTTSDVDYPTTTLIDEDFSLMTKGTVVTPDTTLLTTYGSNNYPYISSSLTHTPGWTAYGNTYQAGGAICLGDDEGNYGTINVPLGDYSGEVTVTFRIKNLASTRGYLFVTFCKGGLDAPVEIDPGYSNFTKLLAKSDNWVNCTFTYKNTYGGDDAFIQINPAYSHVLIDDVKVTTKTSFLAAPIMENATDFTTDGFTAHWSRIAKATDYLLTVFNRVPVSDADSVTITEDFENVKMNADGSLDESSVPEGWEIKLHGTPALFTSGNGLIGGTKSLRMATTGDTITSPNNGGKIKGHWVINLYKLYPQHTNTDATIQTQVYDGSKWVDYGSFHLSDGIPNVRPAKLLLDYNLGTTPQFYQIRLIAENFDDSCDVAFDDFEEITTTPTRNDTIYKDLVVPDTFKVLTGLDPEGDYSYYAKARSTELNLISAAPDDNINAIGLAAPTAQEAKDVDDRGSFTASWNAVPKADTYLVDLYKVYQAPKDIKNYEILNEDFEGLASFGTKDNPTALYNTSLMLLNDYTTNIDWYGRNIICTTGALGCESKSTTYISGELQTPVLSLGHCDSALVTITCCSDTTGDYLAVANLAGQTAYIPLSEDFKTYSFYMPQCQDRDIIVFYTLMGGRFLLDNVEVDQDIKQGDLVYTKAEEYTVSGNDNNVYYFSVEQEDNVSYAYSVTAKYTKDGQTGYSKESNLVQVDPCNQYNGIKTVETETSKPVYYDLSGRKLPSFNGQHGVVIVKNGNKTSKILLK